jgi:sulfur carrier protein
MNVYLNNESVVAGEDVSLSELLHSRNLAEKKGVAVAVNNSVIRKKDWASTNLSENDNILIITAIQGG